MTARKKVMLAVLLLCLLLTGYFAIWGIRTARVESVRKLVDQNLKTGASSEEVIRFLDSRNLEHSELMRPEIMQIGAHNYGNQIVIGAIRRRTARALLWEEAIELVFVFNGNHQLVRADVFPVYTSF